MPEGVPQDELRIFTPIGNVGYGYSTEIFWSTIGKLKPNAIICDSGSTDSGPQKLALGSSTVPRASYECDLEPMVAAARLGTPVIIGSAGGDGANAHFIDIIDGIVAARGYRSLKIIRIYASEDRYIIPVAWLSAWAVSTVSPVYPLQEELVIMELTPRSEYRLDGRRSTIWLVSGSLWPPYKLDRY